MGRVADETVQNRVNICNWLLDVGLYLENTWCFPCLCVKTKSPDTLGGTELELSLLNLKYEFAHKISAFNGDRLLKFFF